MHSKSPPYFLFLVLLTVCVVQNASAQEFAKQRKAGKAALDNGNYKYAYNVFRKLCLDEAVEPELVGGDLMFAVQCLTSLGRAKEFDELLESTIDVHHDNWRLLQAAANQYLNGINESHRGCIISGKFERGRQQGGGRVVSAMERDRIRALQLMQTAIPMANKDKRKEDVSRFYINLAEQLHYLRGRGGAWRLRYLSDLDELPDYDEGYDYVRKWQGAPVDEAGTPIFHKASKSWETAKTDGERWRWCLDQAIVHDPQNLNRVRLELAQFLQSQFGVQTMKYGQWGSVISGFQSVDDASKNESGTIELHNLRETETIAKLASGVKRFDLPDEFNHIKIYQKIITEPKTGHGQSAISQLITIFTNRRQYPEAVKYLHQDIEQNGKTPFKQRHLETIVGNWGAFETIGSQSTGKPATLKYRYRNGDKVRFTAHEVQVTKLLNDVKRYLKRNPKKLDAHMLDINSFGWRLLSASHQKYVGRQAATWDVELKPRPKHFDRRIIVTAPVEKPGTYLVTAELEKGNTCKTVLWLSDTAIVKKQLADRTWYFVGDAETGEPVAKANLEFFGWTQKMLKNNRYQVLTSTFKGVTDNDGQYLANPRDLKTNYQWVIIATTRQGRSAYLGFQGVWQESNTYEQEYNPRKSFGITDRPVYRPGDEVQFKFWTRDAKYELDDTSHYAQQSFKLNVYDPKGESVQSKILQTDDYGGFDGTWKIPNDATLGEYSISTDNGSINFRVEEYKKPEFEVTIESPAGPVMLGDDFTATINAKYHFGSPVTGATVRYKVIRTAHSQSWYPDMPWDWCYGSGYWWFSQDYPWYRDWSKWSRCRQPVPMRWQGTQQEPQEIVIEDKVEIGDDGTVRLNIDTGTAKAFHGDTDHRYTIIAEVRDESRRTIVGTGTVPVARNPFEIFTWTDRGYFEVGETIQAKFRAMTIDQKPIQGSGLLTLMKITYDNNWQPIETAVRRWELDTDAEGNATQQIRAAANGQYRMSYQITDAQGHEAEGGYLFTITGNGFDGANYRFNAVELIPDSREYAPGDKVRLQINSNRDNGTVMLFIRPSNGVYLPPKTVRLKGKSTVTEIKVTRKDTPNFFVEAITVSDGRVHQVTKEIVVPPQRRVLNVEVLPSEVDYKPGETAKVKIHVTDHTGENFAGSLVVTVYDKSVEYISGGTNVGNIKEFFWKWRRHHAPRHTTSLDRRFGDMTARRSESMRPLGIFSTAMVNEMPESQIESGQPNGREVLQSIEELTNPSDDVLEDGSASLAPGGFSDAGATTNAVDLVQPTIRSSFADTALWKSTLATDKTGIAEIELEIPESQTTWKIKVWGMGHGTRVGEAEAELVTRKDSTSVPTSNSETTE